MQLEFASTWEQFAATMGEEDWSQTLTHIEHSPSCSMAKIKEQLGQRVASLFSCICPSFCCSDSVEIGWTGFETIHHSIDMVVESARYLIDSGQVEGLPLQQP